MYLAKDIVTQILKADAIFGKHKKDQLQLKTKKVHFVIFQPI